jgi:hypothetical protein
MKSQLAATLFVIAATTATVSAQPAPGEPQPCPAQPCPTQTDLQPAQQQPDVVAYADPGSQPTLGPMLAPPPRTDDASGWGEPVGARFIHGFRLGWTYVMNMERETRNGMSLASEFGLKSPNMMLLGYEGMYRVIGQSWLNVVLVGNVSVAGLEQSKFIPTANGLIGFEFNQSFQLGVGVNLMPDPHAPTHMIAAAGWTPKVGGIHTPVHFFFVPDADKNHRMGATIGMSW